MKNLLIFALSVLVILLMQTTSIMEKRISQQEDIIKLQEDELAKCDEKLKEENDYLSMLESMEE